MKKRMVLILSLVLLSSQLTASQNYNLIGAGARARGMGGAFIGVADDATAVSWNPAGLARLESPEASVVGLFESYSSDTDIPDSDTDAYKSSHFTLNFVSAAFPLAVSSRNLVAALAYQQVIDLYSKYESDYVTNEQTGGVYAITPAVGMQLAPNLSVGVSVNIFTGTANSTSDYGTDKDETEYIYSGTNFNIGALLDLNQLRVGFTYKTPFELTEEADHLSYDIIYNMPKMIGLGVAFQASENLLFAMDYEMRSYSESEIEYTNQDNKFNAQWEDINQLRMGLEYLKMSGNSILPLRLGFATTPTLGTDDNDDQITGINLTGGVGLIMGSINLDLGLEYNVFAYEVEQNFNTYDYTRNYFRFVVSGVFHFGN